MCLWWKLLLCLTNGLNAVVISLTVLEKYTCYVTVYIYVVFFWSEQGHNEEVGWISKPWLRDLLEQV